MNSILSITENEQKSELLERGRQYLRSGRSIIPVDSRNKGGSLIESWKPYQSKRATEGELISWVEKWPLMGLAIVTGKISGIIVLDIDPRNGGHKTIKDKQTPSTVTAKTGGGGDHYYFKRPAEFKHIKSFDNGGKVNLPGVDLKGDGGFVYAPPSVHESGKRYEFYEMMGPGEVELADPPEWLLEVIRKNQAADNGESGRLSQDDWQTTFTEGSRNAELTRRAGSLLNKMEPGEAFTMLQAWNSTHCKPPLPEKEVKKIIESISKIESKKSESKTERKKYHLTDVGNAKRIVNLYGDMMRYCHLWGKWITWDGMRWVVDDTGESVRLALETVRAIYSEAAAAADDDERKAIAKHALKSESSNKLRSMLEVARNLLPIRPNELDCHKWLLNCKNVTFDLKNGKVLQREKEHYITKVIRVRYMQDASCPKWLKFLNMIMNGNQDLIDFLQKAVGYSLTGITDERCLFILYGTGKNGKTTFIETIAKMLADYAQRTPTQTLLAKRHDGIPNDIAQLPGSRFVYAEESKEGRSLSEELIKDLTGTGTISARFMRAEWFTFKPEFKLWMSTNHKPIIKGTDEAIWDRIRLIPFNVRIPDDKILPMSEVEAMFEAEMPGILNWVLEGLKKWKDEGLEMPEAVKKATGDYRSEMDVLSEFINDCCIIKDNAETTVKDLYSTYSEWCEKNGERGIGKRSFGSKIQERGFDQYQRPTGTRARAWLGIGVKDESRT